MVEPRNWYITCIYRYIYIMFINISYIYIYILLYKYISLYIYIFLLSMYKQVFFFYNVDTYSSDDLFSGQMSWVVCFQCDLNSGKSSLVIH